jgi:PAS domain S-box-containing protein
MIKKILVVDDEAGLRAAFRTVLEDEGYYVSLAGSYDEAIQVLDKEEFDIVYADIILGTKTGIDLLREIRNRGLGCLVVIITGAPTLETATEAVRLGAYEYVLKPVKSHVLIRITSAALKLKVATDKYEKTRRNLEAIFKSVKDAILTVDDQLSVIEFNEAAAGFFGLSNDSSGKSVNVKDIPFCDRTIELLERTVDEKKPLEAQNVECYTGKDVKCIVNINTYPLVENHEGFSGVVVVIRDMTRFVEMERDLMERRRFHNIFGKNEKMQKIYMLIEDLADVESTVLITGESGTGKELVAEALHYMGRRSSMPLVKVNCAALSEELLESELFGHVRGAFTGAIKDKQGRFEAADGGTIFLDEIGDISAKMQVKLLRVIQNKEFERVGETKTMKVDVRIVAATNKSLEQLVRQKKFREDLYYRLKVFELYIPPLRERADDIPLLTDTFIERFNKKLDKKIEGMSREAMRLFMEYPWPGNVRELENALEYASVLVRGAIIATEDLSPKFVDFVLGTNDEPFIFDSDEKASIIRALHAAKWKKAKAARILGMSRQTLYRKIKELNISKN